MAPVIIVGGGISGLSAAYDLTRAGVATRLIERQPHLGGVITTETVEGCLIEGGPDSFLAAKPWALELIKELGLGGDVIGSNDHLRSTFLYKGGRLVPLPDGLMLMVPTKILPLVTTRLLSWPTKISMGLEWFRRPSGKALPDRSVAEFIRDHYGQEAVDYLAEPLLSGVYGGNPERLSINSVLTRFVELESAYGSLTKGVLAERRRAAGKGAGTAPLFRTLKGGLGQLVEALENVISGKLEVLTGAAEAVEPQADGFRVRLGGEWLPASQVILACPAGQAAALLRTTDNELAAQLEAIPYSSSMTVALGYRRAEFRHRLNGFGFLVPRKERRRLIACTWVGTKFSHRVPDSHVLLRCFLGGADDAAVLSESDEAVLNSVREELSRIMGVSEEPCFTRISRWPSSMAQYTVGHAERLGKIRQCLDAYPGLHLAGNGYTGIGVPDCVRMGREAARKIIAAV